MQLLLAHGVGRHTAMDTGGGIDTITITNA